MSTAKWFPRFGDIPGIDYAPPTPTNRSSLPGHNARPTVSHFEFDGRRRESLSWPSKDGTTSQSPASQHQSAIVGKGSSPSDLLRNLSEVLELPGVLSDYHFAIQGCAGALWGGRRDHPGVLAAVERLSWLNIRLLETQPNFFWDGDDKKTWPAVAAFGYLIRLYSREGHLREALDVATRAVRFNQLQSDRDSLQQRLAVIEAEESK